PDVPAPRKSGGLFGPPGQRVEIGVRRTLLEMAGNRSSNSHQWDAGFGGRLDLEPHLAGFGVDREGFPATLGMVGQRAVREPECRRFIDDGTDATCSQDPQSELASQDRNRLASSDLLAGGKHLDT